MKAAHHHRQTVGAELPTEIERARKLIGLNTDQSDHAAAAACANAPRNASNIDHGVALVTSFDLDVDVRPERAVTRAFLDQAVDAGQAVGRQRRAPPLNDIAVLVVMRRLDQDDAKSPLRRADAQHTPPDRTYPSHGHPTVKVCTVFCNIRVRFHPWEKAAIAGRRSDLARFLSTFMYA